MNLSNISNFMKQLLITLPSHIIRKKVIYLNSRILFRSKQQPEIYDNIHPQQMKIGYTTKPLDRKWGKPERGGDLGWCTLKRSGGSGGKIVNTKSLAYIVDGVRLETRERARLDAESLTT